MYKMFRNSQKPDTNDSVLLLMSSLFIAVPDHKYERNNLEGWMVVKETLALYRQGEAKDNDDNVSLYVIAKIKCRN